MKLKVAVDQDKQRGSTFQSKTPQPDWFEISKDTRRTVTRRMVKPPMVGSECLKPGRFHELLHILTWRYACLVREWMRFIGPDQTS